VIAVLGHVVQQRCGRAQVYDEGIYLAVIVVVAKASSARNCLHFKHGSGVAGDVGELVISEAAEQRLLLRDEVNQAAVEDQNVEPAVVVEIVDAAAPTHILCRGLRDAGTGANVFEPIRPGVAHEPVIFRVGHPEIEAAVAIDVGKGRAHGGSALAVLTVGHAQLTGNFLERAVMFVVEEKILGLVVGDVNVGIAVAVVIRRSHAHGPAFVGADAGFVGHVSEGSVAIVVIEAVGVGGIVERARIVVGGVKVAVLGIELHIAADKQDPRSRRGRSQARQS
jgi:hypothetical protein